MRVDIAMNQATTAVLDHNEYVEHPERGGHDDQEITGDDSLGVQAQECRPPQVASWPARWATGKIFPHCARRDLNSEFQKKLIGDAFLAPRRVLASHAADQSLHLRRDRRSTGSRLQAPEQPPARAVPADHRLWAHHHPGVAPIDESAEQRECDAAERIDSPRPGRIAAAPRDNQSLPDRSIYSLLSSAIARRYSDIRYARRSTAPGEFNYCGGQADQRGVGAARWSRV